MKDLKALRSRVTKQPLIYRDDLLSVLDSGYFQLKTYHDRPFPCSHYLGIYRTRCGLAVKRGGNPDLITAMRELITRLDEHRDSPCGLLVVDTGDAEFVLFEALDVGIIAGCLFFDHNQLPGRRICGKCGHEFRGKPPEFLCDRCGSKSVPDSWKNRQ